ncbi:MULTISPECIES: hypothetical protein [unclassified Moraxella]|uniref:hypothetical protein n=1 Tax=unclassified Moraxella TaxID=2685852 RepID=UPI003AF6DA50
MINFFSKNEGDCKPHLNKNYHYLTMPYELGDIIFDEITPTEVLVEVLNKYIQGDKILASTDNDKCCVVRCEKLTTNVIDCFYNPHMNTPFLIFSQDEPVFALIDFDLPLQIIGFAKDLTVEIDNYELIKQGFESVFKRYAGYTNMGNLFKEYYAFLLPKFILEKL